MTTDGNSERFAVWLEREEAERRKDEYAENGNYLPDKAPKSGWRKIQNIKLTLFVLGLAFVDVGMILYAMEMGI